MSNATTAKATITQTTKGKSDMKTIAKAIHANNGSPSLQWFEPLVTGSSAEEWLTWLMEKDAERADGSRYPAVYAVNGAAPYAVSQVTKTLWAAQKMGLISYTQAIHQGKRFQSLAEAVTHSLSGQLNQAAPEITAATVRIFTNDQGAKTGRSIKEEIKEVLEEARQARVREEITEQQLREIALHLKEELRLHELNGISNQSEMVVDEDEVSPDEGQIEAALHEVNELWQYEPKDIAGAETLMVKALKHFGGIDLPMDHPHWGMLVDRAAESLAVMVDYTEDGQDKQKAQAKAETRMAVIEHGIDALPWKARWVVNYLTRRVWRDRQELGRRIGRMEQQMDDIRARMMREEKYNLPAVATRVMTSFPIDTTEEGRSQYFIWERVAESDFHPKHLEYRDERGIIHQLMQGEFQLHTLDGAIARANEIASIMNELYEELRKVEEAMRPIWKAKAGDVMPAEPPIYWNQLGPYLTEEDAQAALQVEWAQREQQYKLRVIGGASTHLQEMLDALGLV